MLQSSSRVARHNQRGGGDRRRGEQPNPRLRARSHGQGYNPNRGGDPARAGEEEIRAGHFAQPQTDGSSQDRGIPAR